MMSDLHCPMCGKPNPDHLEECQHCGARLKPLVVSPSSQGQDTPPDIPPGTRPYEGDSSEGAKPETEPRPADRLSQIRQEDEILDPENLSDEDTGMTEAVEHTEGGIEHVGPLAGLRDLLPAWPEVSQVGKPSAYSTRFQVSETQQANADLLHSLVESEGEAKPAPKKPVVSSQRPLRWVIALGLLLAVLLPIVAQSRITALPELPPETKSVGDLISSLEFSAPVLVAFDYEPGLSGELDAAAAAVFDHLMLRRARLTVVSTSPIGPALGERFLSIIQSQHHYHAGEQYVNLGYISGGATGLHNFSISPQQTISLAFDDRDIWELLDFEKNSAWEQIPLQDVNSLADFALTIVMTDDPDTARYWIEQVQPGLREKSMIMVVSAQAEPLVRPYLESSEHQVSGMVSGLSGGAAYEQFQGRDNLARTYWDPFGISLLMAQSLILVGGIYNLVVAFLNRRRVPARKEQR